MKLGKIESNKGLCFGCQSTEFTIFVIFFVNNEESGWKNNYLEIPDALSLIPHKCLDVNCVYSSPARVLDGLVKNIITTSFFTAQKQ